MRLMRMEGHNGEEGVKSPFKEKKRANKGNGRSFLSQLFSQLTEPGFQDGARGCESDLTSLSVRGQTNDR